MTEAQTFPNIILPIQIDMSGQTKILNYTATEA